MTTLRGKILSAYYGFALIIGAISLFAYLDLAYVDHQIGLGETVVQFKESALEMRAEEKNYLLYRQSLHREEAMRHAEGAARLLDEQADAFAPVSDDGESGEIRATLARYRALLGQLDDGVADGPLAQEIRMREIREAGHRITAAAEAMAGRERTLLRDSIDDSRNALLLSIVVAALLGTWLARSLSRAVVGPLHLLEEELRPIAEGRFERLTPHYKDREFDSFARAINRMLGELEERRRQLLHSEKLASLGVLVSGVAHELNNPLSNISTSAQLLMEEIDDPDPAMQREWIGQIDEQTERARDIVRALLDFSRDNRFRLEPTALRGIVEKSVALLRSQLKNRLDVTLEVPPELIVTADHQRMQQLFINLINNAADAADGHGHLSIRAERLRRGDLTIPTHAYLFGNDRCGVDDETPVTRITIEDDGPGIPPEILPKVFDPFFTTKETGHGMGLGLYVVMEIVEDHEGCIAVESDGGHGARFTLLLPGERSAEEMA